MKIVDRRFSLGEAHIHIEKECDGGDATLTEGIFGEGNTLQIVSRKSGQMNKVCDPSRLIENASAGSPEQIDETKELKVYSAISCNTTNPEEQFDGFYILDKCWSKDEAGGKKLFLFYFGERLFFGGARINNPEGIE